MGILRGKIGNIVAREFNGKQVISAKPGPYKKSKSLKLQAERSKFSSVVNFAKFINSVSVLKSIWNQSNVEGFSAYHKILKTNLLLTINGQLGVSNIIVPVSPNSLQINYTLLLNCIECEILHLQNILSEYASHRYMLQFVFMFAEPHCSKNVANNIVGSSQSLDLQGLVNRVAITLNVSEEIKRLLTQYGKCFLYSTLIWIDDTETKLNWSSTSVKNIC